MKLEIKGFIVPNEDRAVYRFFGYDAVCPRDAQRAIQEAAGAPLEVEINSGGGDVYAGSEIYTALRSYTGGVRIRIVGLAASAAGVVAMSGPCEMSPTALFMLHNVQGRAQGDHRAMDHVGGICRTGDRAIASAYMAKSGMTEEEVLDLMARETWLTAKQAAELKLVDGVMFQENRLVAAETPLLSPEVLQRTRALLAEEQRKQLQARMALLKIGGIQ